ncbi:hypothetical protein ABEF95_010540 [Exophiala dermatitidis]
MGTIAKKLRLRTDHSSLASKKYLGEPDDPHFIPDSPLIDRQMLSEQEEGELKRVCALLLANVPHSDDMSDDPFRYMAAHIQDGKAGQQRKRELPSQPVHNTDSAPTMVSHKPIDTKPDSSTPSEISRLHTMNATDNSTPLTSAGLTPGDSRAAFSDTTRRSVTSTKKSASGPRTEAAPRTRSRKTSIAGRQKSLESNVHSPDLDEVKDTVRLVANSSPNNRSTINKSMETNPTAAARLSAPDLNKSLPPPPPSPPPLRPVESPLQDDPKQPHISRLMKTIRRKKSQIAEERKASTASGTGPTAARIPPIPSAEDGKAATAATFQSSISPSTQTGPEPEISASASASHAAPDHPKKRFRLRLFHRLHRPAGVLVT